MFYIRITYVLVYFQLFIGCIICSPGDDLYMFQECRYQCEQIICHKRPYHIQKFFANIQTHYFITISNPVFPWNMITPYIFRNELKAPFDIILNWGILPVDEHITFRQFRTPISPLNIIIPYIFLKFPEVPDE